MYKGTKIKKTKLLTDYFSRISFDKQKKDKERKFLDDLMNLSEYSSIPNIKNKIKNQFLNYFSKIKKKPINKIETFFSRNNKNFGNCFIIINNLIFYCEIVGCHTIILKTKHSLIRNPIYIKRLNITIIPGKKAICEDEFTLCNWNPYFPIFIKTQIRIQYLKEEILRNVPKVNIDPNALYINIRGGGDIFRPKPNRHYSQPPLCFYEKIINSNKFSNIYIISNDRKNNIIFRHDNYKSDIASLIHAFNVVAPVSSFFFSTIKFNDNLKNLWEYDITRLCEKFWWLHHDLYKFDIKYKIYTMKPSDIYVNKMYVWRFSKKQLKLMIEDKCPHDFVLTKPN